MTIAVNTIELFRHADGLHCVAATALRHVGAGLQRTMSAERDNLRPPRTWSATAPKCLCERKRARPQERSLHTVHGTFLPVRGSVL